MSASATGKKYILYHYDPSLAAAVVFVVLFSLTTICHVFQLFRKRTWYFIPFIVGGLFESIGYIGRVLSSRQSPNWTTGPYIMQSLLLLLAPAFFAASIYMILGRIIRLTNGESHSMIRAKWLTKIFVAGDVLSFLTQSTGGAMLATAKDISGVNLGNWIIIAGLILQIVFFGIFILVAGIFNYRLASHSKTHAPPLNLPWQRYLYVLYGASALIMIRSTFRVIEYAGGQDGILLSTEIYLYIFDATLMFLTMILFNIFHPSSIITRATLGDFERGGSRNIEYALSSPRQYATGDASK